MGYETQSLLQGLRHQQPVEGIAVAAVAISPLGGRT